MVCCPRRVSPCRMQLQEARFGSPLRGDLSAERPSWFRGHGWAQGAEGLRAPSPACPRRRTRGEWVSGARDPQQSSRAQGARGSPAPLCPMESGGPGVETACVEFLHRGTVRLWFAAGGEFPFAGCSSQKLVLGRHCVGTSALSGLAGWGAWLGTGRRRPSRTQSCFPTKENMLGVGFGCRRPRAKQQGPRSQRQPSPASPYAERRAGGENGLRCFPELRRLGVVVCCQGEFPFAGCSSQKLVLGLQCDRASALSGRAGPGGMAGAWAQTAFARPILLPQDGERVGWG